VELSFGPGKKGKAKPELATVNHPTSSDPVLGGQGGGGNILEQRRILSAGTFRILLLLVDGTVAEEKSQKKIGWNGWPDRKRFSIRRKITGETLWEKGKLSEVRPDFEKVDALRNLHV